MVRHTLLHRTPKLYDEYYCSQGGEGIPVFVGERSQRGHGIGSFFSGFGRMILPWLKTGGKALLREGVGTGFSRLRLPAPPGSPARKRIKRQTPTPSVHTKPNKTRAQF
jgi:hypothetical protein